MRLGILGMLAVILAVLWQRYHLSDDQQELARYVEVEVPVLLRAEQPVLQRVADLLDGDFQPRRLERYLGLLQGAGVAPVLVSSHSSVDPGSVVFRCQQSIIPVISHGPVNSAVNCTTATRLEIA